MKKRMFTDTQIIELLGGPTKIAKICKISVPAVSMWKNTGIPADKMVYLGALLEQESKGFIHDINEKFPPFIPRLLLNVTPNANFVRLINHLIFL
jgi:hypothetical protein